MTMTHQQEETLTTHEFFKEIQGLQAEFWRLTAQLGDDCGEATRIVQEAMKGQMRNYIQQQQRQCEVTAQTIRELKQKLEKNWRRLGVQEGLERVFEETQQVPLRHQERQLSELLSQTKQQTQQRKKEVRELWRKYNSLAAKLGREPGHISQMKDISDEAVARVQWQLESLHHDYLQLVEDIRLMCQLIAEAFHMLEIVPDYNNALHRIVFRDPSDACPAEELVARRQDIEHLRVDTEALRTRREEQVFGYARSIVVLWEQLGVPIEQQDAFFDQHQGLSSAVVMACSQHLEQLMVRRAEQLNQHNAKSQQDLDKLWKLMPKSGNGKKDFVEAITALLNPPAPVPVICHQAPAGGSPAEQNHVSLAQRVQLLEEALKMRDREIQRVTLELQKPIIKLLDKRAKLLVEKAKLQEIEQDKNRLLSRKGKNGLEEMRLRKQVSKLKPLEDEIVKRIQTFAEEVGQPFLINGEDILTFAQTITRERDRSTSTRQTAGNFAAPTIATTQKQNQPALHPAPPTVPHHHHHQQQQQHHHQPLQPITPAHPTPQHPRHHHPLPVRPHPTPAPAAAPPPTAIRKTATATRPVPPKTPTVTRPTIQRPHLKP